MEVVAILIAALSAWLIDSAVTGRAPIQGLKAIISGGGLSAADQTTIGGTSMATGIVTAGGNGSGGTNPTGAVVSGNVSQWITQAQAILEANGYNANELSTDDIATIIQHESGGNPNAINLTDSNAAAGHPSQGLMQTIPSTFNAHALPGHGSITNPVDNIIAGVRYAIGRYGSLDNVPGIVSLRHGGKYVGY